MNTVTYEHPADVNTEFTSVDVAAFKPWDNPRNLIDFATMQTVETIINVGFLPVVVVVGVIGNVINMAVFFKQGLQDRINVCLFSLALADCGFLLTLFSYKSFSLLNLFSKTLGNFWKVQSLNTVIGVFWGFNAASVLLTLLVSVERCLCVVSPLRAKQLLKTKVMVVLIILIYIFILPSALIFNVKYTVQSKTDELTNTTAYKEVHSDFYVRNKLLIDVLFYNIVRIPLPCISFIGVLISTRITVIFLRRAVAWKQTSAKMMDVAYAKELAVTKMLLLVCFAFMFFMTPTVLAAFLVQFIPGWSPVGHFFNTFRVYVASHHFFCAVNSSLNFFIYYSRGSKFRSTLRELCCFQGKM